MLKRTAYRGRDGARIALLLAGLLSMAPAMPMDDPGAELLTDMAGPLDDTAPDRKQAETVFMPIPMSNPTVGTGGAIAVMRLFQFDEDSQSSSVTGGAMYTNTESWAVGGIAKLNFHQDKYRVQAGGGYFSMNLDLYGLGVGDRLPLVIPITEKGYFAIAEGLMRFGSGFYIGPRFRYLQVDSSLNFAVPPETGNPLPGLLLTSAGPGLRAMWDTRDHLLYPGSGFNLDFKLNTSLESVGADRNYSTYRLAYSHYYTLAENQVLAARLTLCAASDNAPFYDICLFGSDNALRGYVGGQYRDFRMLTAEAEYRWRFTERFGMVAFAGLGQVAPSFNELNSDNTLPSVGAGLRFMASREHKVDISMDWAFGKDSDALYFYIGQAF
jgi:hypothetical protein